MTEQKPSRNHKWIVPADIFILRFLSCAVYGLLICLSGCGLGGYSSESLYPERVSTVYVEMFDNRTFWRDVEYDLTDALAKRIESETPYKIVSSRDRADTVINGQIETVSRSILSIERQTGKALENDIELSAVVTWKDLKTGQLLLNNKGVAASASYSEWQQQGPAYGLSLAANNLAEEIVKKMEKEW